MVQETGNEITVLSFMCGMVMLTVAMVVPISGIFLVVKLARWAFQ